MQKDVDNNDRKEMRCCEPTTYNCGESIDVMPASRSLCLFLWRVSRRWLYGVFVCVRSALDRSAQQRALNRSKASVSALRFSSRMLLKLESKRGSWLVPRTRGVAVRQTDEPVAHHFRPAARLVKMVLSFHAFLSLLLVSYGTLPYSYTLHSLGVCDPRRLASFGVDKTSSCSCLGDHHVMCFVLAKGIWVLMWKKRKDSYYYFSLHLSMSSSVRCTGTENIWYQPLPEKRR